MRTERKVLVIGLDAASPELVFEKWLDKLPNLRNLIAGGIYGRLKSCVPPITCPAWMVMATGKNPGRLGVYGYRHRKGFSYDEVRIANSTMIKEDTIWDILSKNGRKSCIAGVPQTYPPKPLEGWMISDFLTPDMTKEYTYPSELKGEIEEKVGYYIPDVEEFRTDDKDGLLKEINETTKRRFDVIEYLLRNKDWDFFMFVEIGLDRIQHGFWKFFDPEHRKHEAKSKYQNAVLDYYMYLDQKIGDILSIVPKNTTVLVVSDHGAKRMEGCFNVNDWLMEQGYLKLREKPESVVEFEKAEIDWKKTKAWAWGGYYARIFINVRGREKSGVVRSSDYEKVRDEIARELMEVEDDRGRKMRTRVFKPEEVYGECRGSYPDLIVYFDDLYWRATESIGNSSLYSFETEKGPDDAVHSEQGIFIMHEPKMKKGKEVSDLQILDVAPTILNLMGIEVPEDMEGKIIR